MLSIFENTQYFHKCFTNYERDTLPQQKKCATRQDRFLDRYYLFEDCISRVHLLLNPGKTEVMWCSLARRAVTFDQPSLTIAHSTNFSADDVRALGLQFRADLSPADHFGKVVCSCCYNIRQLRTIRSSLTPDALRDAAYVLILSRLDYCNALYLNTLMCELHRLQMLINTAARVISGRSRLD